MAWFKKEKQKLKASDRRDLPSDVFDKCPECSEILYRERLVQNRNVCPNCGHYRGTMKRSPASCPGTTGSNGASAPAMPQ